MSAEPAVKIEEKVEGLPSMFGEVDRANVVVDDVYRNHISSSYPAYMNEKAIESLEDSVNATRLSLNENRVPAAAIEFTKRKLKREEKRLNDIKESVPRFSQSQMRHISNARKDLDVEIASALFTKMDMEKMNVDPADEAKRMTEPCIKIDKELARACNLRLDSKGLVTRSEAEKARKIAMWHETGGERHVFTDDLRRDIGGHARKSNMATVDIDLRDMEAKLRKLEEELANVTDKTLRDKIVNQADTHTAMWSCPECHELMSTKQKGFHIAMHNRERKKTNETSNKP